MRWLPLPDACMELICVLSAFQAHVCPCPSKHMCVFALQIGYLKIEFASNANGFVQFEVG